RTLSAVLILDWQFISAPVFLVFFLLLVATQPLSPPPLWRAILVTLAGLAAAAAPVVIELTHFVPWTIVWRSGAATNGPPPGLRYALGLAASLSGLALAVLGALSVRAALARRAHDPAGALPLAQAAGEETILQQGNPP